MQYDKTVVSLFSYECVFSDCNSTQNVPKIIYTIHIYNTIYIMYNIYIGLTVTQIWQQNALFSKFYFNSLNLPKKLLKVNEAQGPCSKIALILGNFS